MIFISENRRSSKRGNMKTEIQIKKEIEIRNKKTKFKSYGERRANHTIIETLKWVLEIKSKVKSKETFINEDYIDIMEDSC